jgi:hypothetical protein
MNLSDLTSDDNTNLDRRGGRVSIHSDAITEDMRRAFTKLIRPLQSRDYWKAAVDQSRYVPDDGLWAPQRRAIGLSLAYFAARNVDPSATGAALVKMPTGTGKTGVIATLACAIPDIKRVLVITPRRALVEQMVVDLHTRLWGRFNLIYDGSNVRARTGNDPDISTPSANSPISRLLPRDAGKLSSLASERIVMVGTFSALEQILRPDRPAHRLTGRRPIGMDEIPPDMDEVAPSNEAARVGLIKKLKGFDLVIVDESHYEPAYIWSQCIRNLGRPTVLFSATPYRNDFRYFDIDGRFAFSLSFEEASRERLIRAVEVQKNDPNALPGESFAKRLIRFGTEVEKSIKAKKPEDARVIVRADTYDSLVALRQELATLKQKTVLIHHKEKKADPKSLRFPNVTEAMAAPETQEVRFWLHQWKLLEGVDDSRFGGVAIFEEFATSRAVVQQIGRVLRYTRRGRVETALVMGKDELGADLTDRFTRYLRYEARFDADPSDALHRETHFFETLRAASPSVQYIAGDFRDRFDNSQKPVSFADIQLPRRAFVMRKTGRQTLDEIANASAIAMGLEDRHDITVVGPIEADDPINLRLITYVQWSNSPLLVNRAMPTWILGVMALVEIGDRLFLLDTERTVVDPEMLGLEAEEPERMQRLIPVSTSGESSRVTVASAISLDISDMGIRSITARMRDFSTSFFDLAQGMQAATSVRGQLKKPDGTNLARYLSLQRASVSDAIEQYVPARQYAEWVASISAQLDSNIAPSQAFSRFAQASSAPSGNRAAPLNVLFDFAELMDEDGSDTPTGWDPTRTSSLAAADRCLDVAGDGSFSIEVDGQTFDGKLKYDVTGSVRKRGRYIVELPKLDAYLVKRTVTKREKPQLLSGMLTKSQAFRVLPVDGSLIYAQRHFYRPTMSIGEIAQDNVGGPLEFVIPSPWLTQVESEKGTATSSISDWTTKSVFGGFYAQLGYAAHGRANKNWANAIRQHDANFADLLEEFSIVVCDDGGTELCDFICIDEVQSRVVLVHAKVDDTKLSLNSIQAVGRQAQASLAFLTLINDMPDRVPIWQTPVTIEAGTIGRRIIRGAGSTTKTWEKVRDAIRSGRYTREVWIVAGRILERKKLLKELKKPDPNPQSRQMVYYLASLQTSAARANVGMKIYCSP